MYTVFCGISRRLCLLILLMTLAVFGAGFMRGAAVAGAVPEAAAADLLKMIRAERGKVVVVNFFASWCPPCKEEIPDLIELRSKVAAEHMTLLGISVDEDPKQLEAMVDSIPFNYPVYRGVKDLPEVFAISSIPRLLIYDKSGKLVIDHVGLADPSALAAKIDELKGN